MVKGQRFAKFFNDLITDRVGPDKSFGSFRELAEAAGVSHANISSYRNSKRIQPDMEVLSKLSEALGYAKNYLPTVFIELEIMGERPAPVAREVRAGPVVPSVELRVMGRVAAGQLIEEIEDRGRKLAVSAELVGKSKAFALKVVGDSMIDAGILDGDHVIVISTPNARPGDAVVASIEGEVTLKYFYPQGETVRLEPANRRLQAIIVPADKLEIRGVVVGVERRFTRPDDSVPF